VYCRTEQIFNKWPPWWPLKFQKYFPSNLPKFI
jgi:hypothetical protein